MRRALACCFTLLAACGTTGHGTAGHGATLRGATERGAGERDATARGVSATAALPYAPSSVPDRIVLTWAEDPTTSQTVTWRTAPGGGEPVAEFAIATDGPEFAEKAQQVEATSQSLVTDFGESRYHTATMRDLLPSTKYAYRVGGGDAWSEWSHFTTAGDAHEAFSFVYFGDAQNDLKSHWSRVVREAFKDAPRASFLVHAGDLVNRANSDVEWGEWFYSAGWILRTMPSIATPGNHEYSWGRLSRHWRPTFGFPENGPAGFEETAYYIDYQCARIVSLNTEGELDPQCVWFDSIMQGDRPRWTIVTTHYPMYSTAKNRDNPDLREKLQPLFDKYAVDIVLQGHDHSYGRTARVRHSHSDGVVHDREVDNVPTGVRARSEESGTVYVVSVSGPKMYGLAASEIFDRTAENKQLYQVVSVDRDALRFSAYTATGRLFDRFTLEKVDGGANRFVDQAPR